MENRIEIRPGRTINLWTYINPNAQSTLFLIHGLGGRAEQWRELIGFLTKKYSLIIPELYGHSKSDCPEPGSTNPYSFKEILLDLEALFTKYATQTNVICGHSYGGAFAAALAYSQQKRVSKLILLTPAPCHQQISVPFVYKLPVWFLEWIRPTLEKQFTKLAFNKTTNNELIKIEVDAARKNKLYMIKALIQGMQTIPNIDFTKLTIPTLLVVGVNDLLIKPEDQVKFYSSILNLKIELIDNAAHLVMLERAQEVKNVIGQFLEM